MCIGAPNGKCIDPNMLALAKLYPAPNTNPNATGGYNYVQSEIFNQNNKQWVVRTTGTLATTPKCLSATTTREKFSSFLLVFGGGIPTKCHIHLRSKAEPLGLSLRHAHTCI